VTDGYRSGVAAPEQTPRDATVVVFGEELTSKPPLSHILADVERRMDDFRRHYGDVLPADERFELLSSALDELDAALEGVRTARERLGRIEARLVHAFDVSLARLRSAERELNPEAE
jgi:hypothetical protein